MSSAQVCPVVGTTNDVLCVWPCCRIWPLIKEQPAFTPCCRSWQSRSEMSCDKRLNRSPQFSTTTSKGANSWRKICSRCFTMSCSRESCVTTTEPGNGWQNLSSCWVSERTLRRSIVDISQSCHHCPSTRPSKYQGCKIWHLSNHKCYRFSSQGSSKDT